jgi:threonine dehydrogenase-like Zn-dependent dehydrogenase
VPEQGVQLHFWNDYRVEAERFDLPEPGPRQLLIRVTHSQVSAGSEMNFYRENPVDGPPVKAQLGYMTTGVVAAIGSGVTDFAVGDRVVTSHSHASHHLVDLDSPLPQPRYILPIPDGVSDHAAGFATLGDVALHGIRRAGLQIDESVVVQGAGIVGQLSIQLARVAGAYPIIATDIQEERLALATQSGATHVINSAQESPVKRVWEILGGSGAQTVIHASPIASLLQEAMEMAGMRGKVIITGSAPGTATIGMQVELMRRELSIIGNYEVGIDLPTAYWPWSRTRNRQAVLRLLAGGQMHLDDLVTHVYPAHEARAMREMMVGGKEPWMGVALNWDDLAPFGA